MFHLPHNAIIPQEVQFIIDLIDVSKKFYLYDDLKAMMFEEEIRQHMFEVFHQGMYENFRKNAKLWQMYEDILYERKQYSDVKKIPYTSKKNLNGCWNEQARDYFEFIAFTGLMPSYYKGTNGENEKRYYVGETLKQYKKGKLSYSDILLKMKFRNASKNYDAIEQYDVRNRPFYVALKIMDIFKQKGNNVVSNSTISYYVKTITNEDEIDYNEIEEIDTENWSNNLKREISRGSTFLKRHLEIGFGIQTIRIGTQSFYSLKNFDIKKYKCKSKAIFIGDYYDDIEITPKLIKALMYPTKIEDTGYKRKLIDLQFIKNNEAICDFNIDTDLADRNLVEQVLYSIPTQDIVIEHVENVPYYSEGKMISESGQGTHYEKFLYKILVQKFGDSRIKYLGANTTGKRVSDIVCNLTILNDDGMKFDIKMVIEAKSGEAIKEFDERKEIDDIANTLKTYKRDSYNGVWYVVVDSNQLPSVNTGHGGFRPSDNKLSFKQKLLKIQANLMQSTMKMTMVTAFSYKEFVKFLMSIDYSETDEYISKIYAPDFWTWSSKLMGDSFVTIRG